MAALTVSNEQGIKLVKQLLSPPQAELFKYLILQQWSTWDSLSSYGTERVRIVTQEYDLNWDAMTEEERKAFIDDVVHDGCSLRSHLQHQYLNICFTIQHQHAFSLVHSLAG